MGKSARSPLHTVIGLLERIFSLLICGASTNANSDKHLFLQAKYFKAHTHIRTSLSTEGYHVWDTLIIAYVNTNVVALSTVLQFIHASNLSQLPAIWMHQLRLYTSRSSQPTPEHVLSKQLVVVIKKKVMVQIEPYEGTLAGHAVIFKTKSVGFLIQYRQHNGHTLLLQSKKFILEKTLKCLK